MVRARPLRVVTGGATAAARVAEVGAGQAVPGVVDDRTAGAGDAVVREVAVFPFGRGIGGGSGAERGALCGDAQEAGVARLRAVLGGRIAHELAEADVLSVDEEAEGADAAIAFGAAAPVGLVTDGQADAVAAEAAGLAVVAAGLADAVAAGRDGPIGDTARLSVGDATLVHDERALLARTAAGTRDRIARHRAAVDLEAAVRSLAGVILRPPVARRSAGVSAAAHVDGAEVRGPAITGVEAAAVGEADLAAAAAAWADAGDGLAGDTRRGGVVVSAAGEDDRGRDHEGGAQEPSRHTPQR